MKGNLMHEFLSLFERVLDSVTFQIGHVISRMSGTRFSVARCTCHSPLQLAYVFGDPQREEWMHVDGTYAEMRHVHIERESEDCDGRYSRGRIMTIPSVRPDALFPEWLHPMCRDKTEPDFDDLWRYVLAHIPPHDAYSESEEATIKVTQGRVVWNKRTDEGGEWGEAYVCPDAWCADDEHYSYFRDHTAEAAGY